MTTPCVQLNSGFSMPVIGLGTLHDDCETSLDIVVKAVKSAIDIGYRHLDTALVYGTERGLGKAIQEKIKEGVIKREDVFITTKLFLTYMRKDLVEQGLKRSLDDLGLEYVDMFLIHWPCPLQAGDEMFPKDEDGNLMFDNDCDFLDTWKGMEECQRKGLSKSIGVSNFNTQQLKRVLENCTIKPANLQIEKHIYLEQPELEKYCKENNIVISCYSPLGRPSRPWRKQEDPDLFSDSIVTEIARSHNKSAAQIALRYLVQGGHVIIPKSNNPERQKENINIFDFTLSEMDMEKLKSCNQTFRTYAAEILLGSKYHPFK